MKTTISIGIILLLACAVYGFIDYRHQKQKGKLDELYKDEKYNASQHINEKEKDASLIQSPNETTNSTEEKPGSHQKVINAKEFSRAALEVVDEVAVVENDRQPNNNPNSSKKINSKTTVESLDAEDTSVVVVIDEVQIEPASKSSADSVKVDNNEKEEVGLSLFSRSPIHKKVRKPAAKKHE